MSANQIVLDAIESLREALKGFDSERKTGKVSKDSKRSVQKAVVKLRRSHAMLRQEQIRDQSETIKAVRRLQHAKKAVSNSEFLEAQCEFIVERLNSVQCPELEKIRPSLPSIDDYTIRHKDEPDFVSYEHDQHQFMLNMLASELEERNKMEEEIVDLQRKEASIKNEILNKREFLQSLASKLTDLNRGVDGLAKLLEKAYD